MSRPKTGRMRKNTCLHEHFVCRKKASPLRTCARDCGIVIFMIVTLESNAEPGAVEAVLQLAARFPGIEPKTHVFRGKGEGYDGDQIYFQGHASPGMYSRAFL